MHIASAALLCSISLLPVIAIAQNAQPPGKPAHSPAAADPKKKGTAAPASRDLNGGLALADRALLELDLAWAGFFIGLITGEPNDKTTAAIKAFQKDFKFKETGTLAPNERLLLANMAKNKQDQVGWRVIEDPVTGAQVGLATKQVPNSAPGKSGTRWFSAQGQIQVETFRISGPGTSLADVLEQQKKEPASRHVETSQLRGDSFFLSGMQGLKKFDVRADFRDAQVRGITILYDQATEGIMDPVAVVMASVFAPFPGTGLASLIGSPARRKVEYGSGIVVTAGGHILSDRRLTDGCNVIAVAGVGNADRVAEDQASDLVLLRVYGAGDLVPVALLHEGAKGPALTLVGISDPQDQGGGHLISTAAARLDGDLVSPAPPPGFDGAAAIDAQGRLVGMIELKDGAANAGSTAAPRQGMVIPVETLRKFLDAQYVTPAAGRAGLDAAKAALVRVICIRK
jgi:S1-C subfamily serine protease